MAEYLGEGRSQLRGGRAPRKRVDFKPRRLAPATPSSRKRDSEPRRNNNLKRFIQDFEGGITSLGSAIERLLQHRQFSGGTKLVETHNTIEREKIKTVMVPQVLEREILVARQAAAQPPYRNASKQLITDYQKNAHKVVAAGIPQFLASMLKSEPLRPTRGGAVESLMKVAKAIKAGRLPFVPKKTRKRAQELLDSIYGKRNGKSSTWGDKEISQLIEKHRLIPLAAQTQPSDSQHYQDLTLAATDLPLMLPLPHHTAPPDRKVLSDRPLTELEARKLEATLPRFRDEGMASGPKIIDAGESTMHTDASTVVYRDNSSHVANSETPQLSPNAAAVSPSAAAAANYRSPIPTTRAAAVAPPSLPPTRAEATAPPTPEHKAPQSDMMSNEADNPMRGGLGSKTGGGTAGAGGGTTRIEGELKIAGLDDWIAEVKGTMTSG